MDQFNPSATYDVLKEPRGFVRILQLLFAIFAFASTTSFYGRITITAVCPSQNETKYNLVFSYPFALTSLEKCNPVCDPKSPLYGNFSSAAQFYVFIGVVAFLYCIGVLALYTIFVERYESVVIFRKADFGLSAFIVLLWFVASAVWARGVDQLKRYTSEEAIKEEICKNFNCTVVAPQGYAGLNISLVFGFSNVALWAAALWFLWKETPWFRGESDPMRDAVLPPVDGAPL
uniref:MARVEL domain-containing protein n=1 Tax=Mesocestoides corti TaxID=53468 RepID=A0A5K3EP78_MESCO